MPAPPNQTCLTAIDMGSTLPFVVIVNTALAGNSPATPDTDCGSGSSFNSVWYKKTIPDGLFQLAISITSNTGDGIVTIFSGSCGSLTPDPADCTYVGGPLLLVPVTPGTTYFFMLTTYIAGGAILDFTAYEPEPFGDLCATLTCCTLAVTGMTLTRSGGPGTPCDTITVDGTCFDPAATVDLQGPLGVSPTFDTTWISAEQIVLSNVIPIASGTNNYCVTVTNP